MEFGYNGKPVIEAKAIVKTPEMDLLCPQCRMRVEHNEGRPDTIICEDCARVIHTRLLPEIT